MKTFYWSGFAASAFFLASVIFQNPSFRVLFFFLGSFCLGFWLDAVGRENRGKILRLEIKNWEERATLPEGKYEFAGCCRPEFPDNAAPEFVVFVKNSEGDFIAAEITELNFNALLDVQAGEPVYVGKGYIASLHELEFA